LIISQTLQAVIDEFNKFPGIGRKTAQRLTLYLLRSQRDDFDRFIATMQALKEKIHACPVCFNFTEYETCEICTSTKRDRSKICVVEDASDIMAIEKSNEYRGLYHVLGGVISPLSGVQPEDLRIKELLLRLRDDEVKEIIMAVNPDTEGEATALYILKLLRPMGISVSRLARGIPVGGDLEFTDEATIGRAVIDRAVIE
jgi:recombination protein RecR